MGLFIKDKKGLTLIELMISLAIISIIMTALYQVYDSRQKSHRNQRLLVDMQQNSRAAISLMKREIRLAGYDPTASNNFSILAAGNNTIAFTMDLNLNGVVDMMQENIIYGIAGDNLMRNADVLAYGIEILRFGYAFDTDGNGLLETTATYDVDGDSFAETPEPGAVIWAFDSDNDGDLDRILDTNYDGLIDAADTDGGVAMPAVSQVDIADIRAVRIYLLARTSSPVMGYIDNRTYVVGDLKYTPAAQDKGFRRQLLVCTASCKNMGY